MSLFQFVGSAEYKYDLGQMVKTAKQYGVKILCLTKHKELANRKITFEDILFDERYAQYGFFVEKELLVRAGGINSRFGDGQYYELLLRLVKLESIHCVYEKDSIQTCVVGNFYTDAYILGRYSEAFKRAGYFEEVTKSLISQAGDGAKSRMDFLASMIGRKEEYWKLYRQTQPVLVIKGQGFCYNIVNDMLDGFAEGLRSAGQGVKICHISDENQDELKEAIGKQYKAVVGFQTFISTIYLRQKDIFLTDLIGGPKFEMTFDHPFWFHDQLNRHGKDVFYLSHDENYVNYVQKYETNLAGAYSFVPGGVIPKIEPDAGKKNQDLVFLGTYNNYRERLAAIRDSNKEVKRLACAYLKKMKCNVNKTAEWALHEVLMENRMDVTEEAFTNMMHELGNVCQCIMYYYREKIVDTLIKAQIELHVYGEDWKKSPWAEDKHLVIHDSVEGKAAQDVLLDAKISLNVFAWHKGGFNERIVNSMLAKAAVVTDKSTYLEENFHNGEELFWFDLEKLNELPKMVWALLADEAKRKQMAERAYEVAKDRYSWEQRAKEFLALTNEANKVKDIHGKKAIVITVNRRYIKYLYVCLLSFFDTNQAQTFCFYLVEPDFTAEDKQFVEHFMQEGNTEVVFVETKKEMLAPYREFLSERFSDMVYYRLMLAELLPQEVEKFLLMDVDLIVKKDLSPWFAIDCKDNYFAAAVDMVNPQIAENKLSAYHRAKGGETRYFNGGMVLWNAGLIRKELGAGYFMEQGLAPEIPKLYNEQDILNALCGDRVLFLDPIEVNPIIKQCEKWLGTKDFRGILEEKSMVFHYAGDNPWRSTRKAKCYDVWWEYAKRSPFYLEILEDTQSNLEDNYEEAMERSARMYQLILKLNEENARLNEQQSS